MITLTYPLPYAPYAIILNGQRECLERLQHAYPHYQHIIVCDGAWFDVVELLQDQQDFEQKVIGLGDGDSIRDHANFIQYPERFIHIHEQDSTDFEKALLWLINNHHNRQIDTLNIDVYWANGGELDHLLGNLAISAKYYSQFHLHFYSDNQYFCYLKDTLHIIGATGKTLSLFPFPHVTIKKTQGLAYPMSDYELTLHTKQSLRNQAISHTVIIEAIGDYMLIINS